MTEIVATGKMYQVEFYDGDDGDPKPAGTYVTVRIDDPTMQWNAGRVEIRYLPIEEWKP